MKIAESSASVLLSSDGQAILSAVGIEVGQLSWLDVDVAESEDLGIWIRIDQSLKPQLLLVRWEYILAVALNERPQATIFGLKG